MVIFVVVLCSGVEFDCITLKGVLEWTKLETFTGSLQTLNFHLCTCQTHHLHYFSQALFNIGDFS